jgi:tetratricopeptide (TPR) repeat protein/tRNA A-37 threonylcarbamoyl transferase component Bud32
MQQNWICPRGHRWEYVDGSQATGNPGIGCPVCGSPGKLSSANAQSSSRLPDETLDAPRPATPPRSHDETLDPTQPLPTPIPARPATDVKPVVPDLTLDKPAPSTHAETLAGPPAKPTAVGHEPTLDIPTELGATDRMPAGGPARPVVTGRHAGSGTTVDEYEIIGELGRGGMGMVYKARQVRLNRIVALKMIRAGIHADPMDLLRFQREAEAVAQLRHPNIVQIFEVGERNGMPFFSLEFVEGGSLQQKLDGKPRPPRETAGLIAVLARAMDFAHKQGIIHRDLKPANILLTADGTPKITDFGLAKKLDETDTGQTGTGAILGTPTYMAPEQAKGKNRLIGPPADIYALGAILYDLLTGRPPFKGETIMDTLMMVQNVEPVPPTRIQPKLPRDLETICLKCLQKEPAQRYGTALELSEDLESFLNDRPIKARKVSAAERAWKWAKRRPAAASLIVVCVFALLALGVGGWVFAQREADRATVAENLKKEADQARDASIQEQKRAETNLYRAFDSGDQLFLRISQEALLNQPAMEKVRRDLLLRSLAFYQGFLKEDPKNRNVLYDLGRAQRRVATIYEKLDDPRLALQHFNEAEKTFERLALENPGRSEYLNDEASTRIDRAIVLQVLERFDEAEKEFECAATLLTGLVQAAGHIPEFRRNLAASYIGLAALLQMRKRDDGATVNYRKVIELLEVLLKDSPDDEDSCVKLSDALNNLGVLLQSTDRQGARKCYERALALVRAEPKEASLIAKFGRARANAHLNLGTNRRQEGEIRAAEKEYELADTILKSLTERYPYTAEFQLLRASAQRNLGGVYAALRQSEKERVADELAYALLKHLHEKNPDNPTYSADLAKAATELGFALGPTSVPEKVLVLWGEAASLWQGLSAKHPGESGFRVALGKCLLNRGKLFGREGQATNALREYAAAIVVYESLSRDHPAEKMYLADWIDTYDNQARTFAFLAKGKEAETAWQSATDLGKKWATQVPSLAIAHLVYANALVSRGQALIQQGDGNRGRSLLEKALPERYAVATLEAKRLDRRLDWHKLELSVVQSRAEMLDPDGVFRFASGWLSDWKKLKPLKGEDPEGRNSFRAAELVAKCMGLIDEKRKQEFGDLTMQFLRLAVDNGFRDRLALENSADLLRLRGREDFVALLKMLSPQPAGGG